MNTNQVSANQPAAPNNTAPRKIRVGITHGDTNGVGYEIILKTFADAQLFELCTPIVYGSAKVGTYHRKAFDIPGSYHIITQPSDAEEGVLNLVNCFDEEVRVEFGHPSAEAGEAAFKALERAVADCNAGEIDVLVTAPVNKGNINTPERPFSGHTDYLKEATGASDVLMILSNSLMRVALVTTHVPLRAVAEAITEETIMRKARLFYRSLRSDFRISAPRIAVLALNPHRGDNGLIGTEEDDIITPAIQALRADGVPCFGPYAADGFFGSGHYRDFDGVLAMYHDQGLAPLKALSHGDGVNITAGLPFVRTSPDHGTAYDIAGRGVARFESFREAIYSAIDLYRNRTASEEAAVNPLPKLYHDRREEIGHSRRPMHE